MAWGRLHVNKIFTNKLKHSSTPSHGFQSLCKVSSPYLKWFLRYACLNRTTTTTSNLKTDLFEKLSTDYVIKAISWIHALLMIQISLTDQKLDLIETESET